MSKITIRIECDFHDGELKTITDGLWSKAEENILRILRRHDKGGGVSKSTISHNASHSADAKGREAILEQLLREGIIEIVKTASHDKGARYKIAGDKRK